MEPFNPIPGKPPRKVVIDRQRKLFASLDIEELLLELVSKSLKLECLKTCLTSLNKFGTKFELKM